MKTHICYKGKVHNSLHIPQKYREKTFYICKEPLAQSNITYIRGHNIEKIDIFEFYDTPYIDSHGSRHIVPKEDIDLDLTKEYEVPYLPEDDMVSLGM